MKKYICIFLSFLLCISFIGCSNNKTKQIEETSSKIEEKILNDDETEKVFSKYTSLYEECMDLIDEGISGKVANKIYDDTKDVGKEIRELNLKDKYLDKQDKLAYAFEFLNVSMDFYKDYIKMQVNNLNGYKDCLDNYHENLTTSKSCFYSIK